MASRLSKPWQHAEKKKRDRLRSSVASTKTETTFHLPAVLFRRGEGVRNSLAINNVAGRTGAWKFRYLLFCRG